MVKICRILFLFTVFMFVFVQVGICASPVTIKGANVTIKGAKITPKASLSKMTIKPNLSVTAMQFENTQDLREVKYQMKVKNLSSRPYSKGAILEIELLSIYQIGNQKVWKVVETGINIGPIGPGKEVNLRGTVIRAGNTHQFKAVIKAGNSIIDTYSKQLPTFPVLDIRITGVQCEDDGIVFTIENFSNYITQATVSFLFARIKADGSFDYSNGGGGQVTILRPRDIQQYQTKNIITQDVAHVKASVTLPRTHALLVAERVVNPKNCGQ